ncbi:hypothetical protein AaE_000350 [Aphanomyces astaci]|uniref:Uncharacterized protein n=1 Tax=Aphanomyces astaci TaxID=112090 RepID=A0A6A5B028_APHAT|nr:hypothetical protein AaE_000350 [Aphanomyces astaci]
MPIASIFLGSAAWWMANYVVKEPCHTSALKAEEWIAELLGGNPRRFRKQLRMLPSTFLSLLDVLQTTLTQAEQIRVCQRKVGNLSLHLWPWGIQSRRSRAISTQWVDDLPVHQRGYCITIAFVPKRCCPSFQGHPLRDPLQSEDVSFFAKCVGALDGTHIRATPPQVGGRPFRNRKGYLSQNVLAACTFDMRFVYVLAGSSSDGRVLDDALTEGFSIPNGKMFLGDAGYELKTNLMTPYRGVRYHLREWSASNQRPQNAKELFNLRHAQQRNCVERIFGVFWTCSQNTRFKPK